MEAHIARKEKSGKTRDRTLFELLVPGGQSTELALQVEGTAQSLSVGKPDATIWWQRIFPESQRSIL